MYKNDELLYTQEDIDEWMRTCEELQEHIKEQEEEIEKYNNYFKSFGCKDFAEFQRLIGLTKISANDKERDDTIRKQVCNEIRNALTSTEPNCSIEDMNSNLYEFTGREIYAILEQIEKGEEE